MKINLKVIMIIAILAIGVILLEHNLSQEEEQNFVKEYIVVRDRRAIKSLRATGTIIPEETIEVMATLAESISEVKVSEGDRVEEGGILYTYDTSLIRADLKEAKANLEREEASMEEARASVTEAESLVDLAETKLENAKVLQDTSLKEEIYQASLEVENAQKKLKKLRYLYDQGAIEEAQLEEQEHRLKILKGNKRILVRKLEELEQTYKNRIAEAEEELRRTNNSYQIAKKSYNVAKKSVQVARESYQKVKLTYKRHIVTAPIDGIILDKSIEKGEYVQPGQKLMEVSSFKLLVKISPDEKELNLLDIGQKGIVSADAFPNQRVEVRVLKKSPKIDEERGTIDVYLEFIEESDYFIPNMSVSVEILNQQEEFISVPNKYLFRQNNREYLYIYQQGRVVQQKVKTGSINNGQIEIKSGISSGDKILSPKEVEVGDSVTLEE